MEELGTLLERARAGDRDAFGAIVQSQLGRLYGTAFRIAGDRHAAEDIVQDVFLRILRVRSSLKEAGAAESWLTRITVRLALDHVRARAARRQREERYAALKAGRERMAGTGEDRMKPEDREVLSEALAGLTAEARACLWLHFAEGLSVREVASHLGRGKSSTAQRIQQAVERCRTFLAKRGFSLGAAVPVADLLRSLPQPGVPQGLAEKVREAAGREAPGQGLATIALLGVKIMAWKKITVAAAALAVASLAGWGGLKLLERRTPEESGVSGGALPAVVTER